MYRWGYVNTEKVFYCLNVMTFPVDYNNNKFTILSAELIHDKVLKLFEKKSESIGKNLNSCFVQATLWQCVRHNIITGNTCLFTEE